MENNKPKKRSRIGLYAMWMSLGIVVAGAAGYGIAAAAKGDSDPEATKEHEIQIIQEQTSGFKIESNKSQAKRGDVVVFIVKTNTNPTKIPTSLRITSTKEGEEGVFAEYPLTKNGDVYEASVTITFTSNMKVELRLEQHFIVTFDQNEPDKQTTTKTTVNVKENDTVSKPLNPAVKGYIFKYWSTSKTGTEYNFDTPVTSDTVLYAIWGTEGQVTKVELNKTAIDFDVNDSSSQTLTATVTPSTGVDADLVWTSSDTSVASLAVSADTHSAIVSKATTNVSSCVITVTSVSSPSVSVNCKVNITNNVLKFEKTSQTECSVSTIDSKASSLTGHLTIPEKATIDGAEYKVTSITNYGLNGTNLTSIFIPSTITSIGEGAFKDNNNLESIFVDPSNTKYTSKDGILYSYDCKTLIAVPSNKTFESTTLYSISSSVICIESYAFYNIQKVACVNVSSSVFILKANWLSNNTTTLLNQLTFDNTDGSWIIGGTSQPLPISKISPSDNFTTFCGKAIVSLSATDTTGYSYFLDDQTMTCSIHFDLEYSGEAIEIVVPEYIVVEDETSGESKSYKVTGISDVGFIRCEYLTSITLPKTITEIPSCAFMGCSNLNNVVLPETIESIGHSAFEDCSNLYTINLPDSIKTIEDYAFNNCNYLWTEKLPENIEYIGEAAFCNCNYIFAEKDTGNPKELALPKTLKTMGYNPFQGCYCISKFSVNGNNYYFAAPNGFLTDYNEEKLIAIPAGMSSEETEYKIDLNYEDTHIYEICPYAFTKSQMALCILPKTLSKIDDLAFADCFIGQLQVPAENNFFMVSWIQGEGLYGKTDNEDEPKILYHVSAISDSYFVPASLTQINDYTNYLDSSIKWFEFGNAHSLKVIGHNAFYGLTELQHLDLDLTGATSLTTISSGAFDYINFTEVKIPSNVTTCEGFFGITQIESVYCDSSTIANVTVEEQESGFRPKVPLIARAKYVYVNKDITLSDESYINQTKIGEPVEEENYIKYTLSEYIV